MTDEEFHELLIRLDVRTENMETDIKSIGGRLDSHAAKIRALEHWRSFLTGAGSLIGADRLAELLKKWNG